jgi:GTP pyrophosphokinase
MLEGVLAEVRLRNPDGDVSVIERAFETAYRAHHGQKRRSGEPYLMHPLRVSETIARLGLGPASVAAALMHDSVEDSELSVFDLTDVFGREVANLVDGVTKLGKIPYLSRKEQQAESFRKMLLAMSKDIRVLLVKLADRLDNMRTLEHMPPEKRERIARETMEIYAPLARRLGVDWLRSELQDLSFRYLEPVLYDETSERMDVLLQRSPKFVDEAIEQLRRAFGLALEPPDGVPAWSEDVLGPVELRATLRSTYKVHRVSRDGKLEQVSDLITYQVVTRDRAGCYAGLGQIHAAFKPVPGRFRDYIALPRPNHYQALHTTVVDRDGRRMEVQLRSQGMDAIAERGIVVELTAPDADPVAAGETGRYRWLAQLMDWQDQVSDPNEFIEAVKTDLFADEVYVFTPQGDIQTFPPKATPIDFAFSIHTDVGQHCSGARVNGQVVPLRYRLRQGDTVEILTNPRAEPKREWLRMAATSRARAKIKQFLRHKERTRQIETGRSLIEQRLAARDIALRDIEEQGLVVAHADSLGTAKERGDEGIYEEVGSGRVTPDEVIKLIAPDEDDEYEAEQSLLSRVFRRMSGRPQKPGRVREGDKGSPIVIDAERISAGGRGDGLVALPDCCSPLPGDPLVGFLVPGKGIVAHVQGCPEALDQVEERRVYLAWEDHLELDRPVTVEVRTTDTVGLLAEMSRVFSHHRVNIKQALCRAYDQGRRALNTFHVNVRSLQHLDALTAELKDIKGVISVERVFGGGDESLTRSSAHG